VNESLANAARHGGATRAEIALAADDGVLRVRVADNGRGFPFGGRHELEALEEMGNGPRTLKERVSALKGRLAVESSARGAVIEVTLPIAEESNW
jgi:signal transduction histidine kinase